ncbi:MAG: septum formation initiator family protein [Crocinitomicaceae bacterium]|jgi:cell division protein DivIC|nr:septum formation initiator family protein [Crocinitomicaceae bacterium]MBK6950936.1 septum formation initiator family protein [Crocinitomicaceae bacterium]MBK9592035.1 septum formation initiator family protein [Crocinitomicaceae bacterium]
MKKFVARLKNRYAISTIIAVVYILLLHNTDVYTLIQRKNTVSELETEIARKKHEIEEVKANIASLQDIRSLEKYARENYFFKKDDEELFIFSFE